MKWPNNVDDVFAFRVRVIRHSMACAVGFVLFWICI